MWVMWMRCQAQRRTPLELKDSQVSTLPLITTFHFLSFVGYVGAVPGTRVVILILRIGHRRDIYEA
jgi:hypothetical protein